MRKGMFNDDRLFRTLGKHLRNSICNHYDMDSLWLSVTSIYWWMHFYCQFSDRLPILWVLLPWFMLHYFQLLKKTLFFMNSCIRFSINFSISAYVIPFVIFIDLYILYVTRLTYWLINGQMVLINNLLLTFLSFQDVHNSLMVLTPSPSQRIELIFIIDSIINFDIRMLIRRSWD